jgi:hypothetical protein
MQDKQRWQQLCEQAAVEQDWEKLMALLKEVDRLLSEDENRRKANRATNVVPISRQTIG